ncbi:MAG: YabP/YqfC family sporulation protein [Eubacteriales bacterium]|nr:YabP/YqfC family sporulation protein [Eubacteriales bacterium]
MNLGRKVSEALEIPGDAMFGLPSLQWTGQDRLVVQNHRGIVDYTPQSIVIDTRQGQYRVGGEGLYLEMLSREMLVLRGEISAISLYRRDAG